MVQKKLGYMKGKIGVIKRNRSGKFSVYGICGEEIAELSDGSFVEISVPVKHSTPLHVRTFVKYNGKDYVAVDVPHISLEGLICRILVC